MSWELSYTPRVASSRGTQRQLLSPRLPTFLWHCVLKWFSVSRPIIKHTTPLCVLLCISQSPPVTVAGGQPSHHFPRQIKQFDSALHRAPTGPIVNFKYSKKWHKECSPRTQSHSQFFFFHANEIGHFSSASVKLHLLSRDVLKALNLGVDWFPEAGLPFSLDYSWIK